MRWPGGAFPQKRPRIGPGTVWKGCGFQSLPYSTRKHGWECSGSPTAVWCVWPEQARKSYTKMQLIECSDCPWPARFFHSNCNGYPLVYCIIEKQQNRYSIKTLLLLSNLGYSFNWISSRRYTSSRRKWAKSTAVLVCVSFTTLLQAAVQRQQTSPLHHSNGTRSPPVPRSQALLGCFASQSTAGSFHPGRLPGAEGRKGSFSITWPTFK